MSVTRPARLLRWLAACALALSAPLLSQGGTAIRLSVDNTGGGTAPSTEWKGSVTAANYVDWVELASASFTLGREVTSGPNQPITLNQARFGSLGLFKFVDRISPRIFRQIATGGAIAKVSIDYLQSAGATERLFMRVELEEVQFSTIGSSAGSDAVTESVEVFFAKMTLTYFPVTGDPVIASYDQTLPP